MIASPTAKNAPLTSQEKKQLSFAALSAGLGALFGLGGFFLHPLLPLFLYGAVGVAGVRFYSNSLQWKNVTDGNQPAHVPMKHKTLYFAAAGAALGLSMLLYWFPLINLLTCTVASFGVSVYFIKERLIPSQHTLNGALEIAAASGDTNEVNRLLTLHADPLNPAPKTALENAIQDNDQAATIIEVLLAQAMAKPTLRSVFTHEWDNLSIVGIRAPFDAWWKAATNFGRNPNWEFAKTTPSFLLAILTIPAELAARTITTFLRTYTATKDEKEIKAAIERASQLTQTTPLTPDRRTAINAKLAEGLQKLTVPAAVAPVVATGVATPATVPAPAVTTASVITVTPAPVVTITPVPVPPPAPVATPVHTNVATTTTPDVNMVTTPTGATKPNTTAKLTPEQLAHINETTMDIGKALLSTFSEKDRARLEAALGFADPNTDDEPVLTLQRPATPPSLQAQFAQFQAQQKLPFGHQTLEPESMQPRRLFRNDGVA
jgi:hypothetical protein